MSRTIVVERISYTVFPIDGGKRLKTWAKIGAELKPITATTEKKIREKLKQISVDLLNGRVEAAGLEPSDHRSFIAAREILQPYGISVDAAARENAAAREALAKVGLPIDVAARELANALEQLGGARLADAVSFYLQHHGGGSATRTVAEVIEEFLRAIAPRSMAYRDVFRKDLARLSRSYGATPITALTTSDLETFLSAAGQPMRTGFRPASDFRRKQIRGELVTFFNFARKRKYLPQRLDTVAHSLETIEPISEAREVWDPEHLRRSLEAVWAHDREWLPWLAISALANVRSVPTQRLVWTDLHWLDDLIELPARKSKIKQRVTVGISPALADWLEPFRGRTGPICPQTGFVAFTQRLREKYELPYYQNVIRRSYITYLLAETDDEVRVAHLANTSVSKLRANYRKIRTLRGRMVTKELASLWFATARISASNVVQLELTDHQGTKSA